MRVGVCIASDLVRRTLLSIALALAASCSRPLNTNSCANQDSGWCGEGMHCERGPGWSRCVPLEDDGGSPADTTGDRTRDANPRSDGGDNDRDVPMLMDSVDAPVELPSGDAGPVLMPDASSICAVNFERCGSQCIPAGQPCMGTCPSGQKLCGTSCVSPTTCCTNSQAGCPSCQSCNGGTCQPVMNGMDCGSGMVCNQGSCTPCQSGGTCSTNPCVTSVWSCSTGTRTCVETNKAPNTPCGEGQSCTGSTLKTARVCNGSGLCMGGDTTSCAPFACNGNACANSCPAGTCGPQCQTCTSSQFCDGAAGCAAKRGLQASCSSAGQCLSGNCCSGKCVDVQADHDNCGACGDACAATKSCVGGQCKCPSNTLDTGNFCEECGDLGKRCCAGNTCPRAVDPLICYPDTDTCVRCGDDGQFCCAGGTCPRQTGAQCKPSVFTLPVCEAP